jgi:predicted acylesterase/phospholipase RssA
MIKHLVISGGGPAGLMMYGAAKHLAQQDFWKLQDIKSIYACSIGAYLGVVLALDYEWAWLDDYFIERPWEKMKSLATISFLQIFEKKGLLDENFIRELIGPLLTAKNISLDITLAEFYAVNKIDIHIFTTNINGNEMQKVDLSHSTHPHLTLIKALNMSMAYPMLFKPICCSRTENENAACYIDGGLVNNFPLHDCLTQEKCQKDEILAFKNILVQEKGDITQESSLFDFFMTIVTNMSYAMDRSFHANEEEFKYIVPCLLENLNSLPAWLKALATMDIRVQLIEKGLQYGQTFLMDLHVKNYKDVCENLQGCL